MIHHQALQHGQRMKPTFVIWKQVSIFFFEKKSKTAALFEKKKVTKGHLLAIRGTQDTPYEGGLFRLRITIPQRCERRKIN
jgi:ubiquitin-protein ligase